MTNFDDIVRTGDTRRKKLDELQEEIFVLQNQISFIESAKLVEAEVRAALTESLQRKLESERSKGEPFAHFLLPPDVRQARRLRLNWPELNSWTVLVAVLGLDQIVERVMAHLDAKDGDQGLPMQERIATLARLRERLEATERAEELETVELERQGLTILRRKDANPRLLLDVHRSLYGTGLKQEPLEPVMET